jgi:predicted dienelactone hydrolase
MERSNLDDPQYAAFAWGRYRRILWWMAVVSLAAVIVSLWLMDRAVGPLEWHTIIATSAGVFATVMLGAGLMGLVFLSHGTGHDDSIVDPFEDLAP